MKTDFLLPGTTQPCTMRERSILAKLSSLLPLLLLLVLPALAQAQFDYTVENNTVTITGYTGPGGEVLIPDTIDGLPVTSIGPLVFWQSTSLTGVTIPDSVTSIGVEAFSGCTSLRDVSIPESVTSIEGGAFEGCTGLTNFVIGDSVTSVGPGAFQDCTGLTSITFGNHVVSLEERAFFGCSSLTTVTIPDSVTNIGDDAFYLCTSLTTVRIGTGVTDIGWQAFMGCTSLTSVYFAGDAPDLGRDSDAVFLYTNATIYYRPGTQGWEGYFGGRPTLPWETDPVLFNYTVDNGTVTITGYTGPGGDVVIPDTIEGLPVSEIGDYAFHGRTSMTSVEIPNNVTSIGEWAFRDCYSLTHVMIPDGVTSIGDWAFSFCLELTSVSIPKNVARIGPGTFHGCSSLTAILVDPLNPAYNTLDGVLFDRSQATLIQFPGAKSGSYTVPDGVNSIGDYAFDDCTALNGVVIPDSVTNVGMRAFQGCGSLASVAIGNGVSSIGDFAFAGCAALTSITIGSSVATIGEEAFSYCPSLASIVIPASVTGFGRDAFYGCSSLSAVYFEGDPPDLVGLNTFLGTSATIYYLPGTSGWGAEYGGRPTTPWGEAQVPFEHRIENGTVTITKYTGSGGEVVIPETLGGLPVTAIGRRAFGDCESVTSITISDSVTNIGSGAFESCRNLTSITIPNSVISIGNEAFSLCTSLTIINIPDSVTSIGNQAFYGCVYLTSVTIGNGVANIGDGAFSDCGLTSITIPNSVITIGNKAFRSCNSLTAIEVDVLNPTYGSVDGVLIDKIHDTLIACPEGKTGDYVTPNSVTSIGVRAFEDCVNLTSMTIADGVINIGNHAFMGCTGLTNVTIPNGITSIEDRTFYNCTSLISIKIPDSVTSIGWRAFNNCTSLTSVTIPDSVISIGDSAFYGCAGLATITIPNSVISIGGWAFVLCETLTTVTIGNGVISIGDAAFLACSRLTAIEVDALNPAYSSADGLFFNKSVTTLIQCPAGKVGDYVIPGSVTSIAELAFAHCASLTGVTIPDSVTSLGRAAFYDCTNLKNITIPDSLTRIPESAFADCVSLTSVVVPNSVRTMESGAFAGCSSLTAAYFEGDAPIIEWVMWGGEYTDGVFEGAPTTVYYRPGTLGWGAEFEGRPTMPWGVVWGSPVQGDVSGDEVVDRNDLSLVVASRNLPAVNAEDPRDLDGDGIITVLDARMLVTLFTVPAGFTRIAASPDGVVLEWNENASALKLQSTDDLQTGPWQNVGGLQSPTNAVIGTSADRMFFRLVLPE